LVQIDWRRHINAAQVTAYPYNERCRIPIAALAGRLVSILRTRQIRVRIGGSNHIYLAGLWGYRNRETNLRARSPKIRCGYKCSEIRSKTGDKRIAGIYERRVTRQESRLY